MTTQQSQTCRRTQPERTRSTMMLKLMVAIVLACSGSTIAKPPSQIVGGKIAATGEFPWQASIRLAGRHICGGSILDEKHILTAAHCVRNDTGEIFRGLTVLVGTNKVNLWAATKYRVKSAHPHEEYETKGSYRHDIAIITLAEPIPFNDRQKAIGLPQTDVSVGADVTLSGWGVLKYSTRFLYLPSSLMKLDTTIVSNKVCQRAHGKPLYPEQICAYSKYGEGICAGDSGSPLVHKDTVVGVASWVIGCGIGYPDVYTRVYSHVAWITQTIAAN